MSVFKIAGSDNMKWPLSRPNLAVILTPIVRSVLCVLPVTVVNDQNVSRDFHQACKYKIQIDAATKYS